MRRRRAAGTTRRLSSKKLSDSTFVQHKVDLADRSDATLPPPNGIVSKTLQLRNAVVFVSEPLKHSQEFSGLFSGKLGFHGQQDGHGSEHCAVRAAA